MAQDNMTRTPAANSRFELVCDLVELPFRIIFSTMPKIERLRTTHHLKAAERYKQADPRHLKPITEYDTRT